MNTSTQTAAASTPHRVVGWFWLKKGCAQHYFKDVWEWRYDDEKKKPVYVHIGIMAMDDFGDLFPVGPQAAKTAS